MWGFESLLPCQFWGRKRADDRSAGKEDAEMSQATRVRDERVSRGGSAPSGIAGRVAEWPRKARQFLHETRNQLRLVTWPSGREVYSTTIVVVVTVAFFAAFFWLTDSAFSYASQWVLTHFKH
jgi:preprotein translocase subunit SecE